MGKKENIDIGSNTVDTVQQRQKRSTSGARAIALDQKIIFARYRLSILLSVLGSAAFALVLHLIFLR
jgi:hypothetical protein